MKAIEQPQQQVSREQQEMLQFLDDIRKQVTSGRIASLAIITTGADGINCGFSEGDPGQLVIGSELLKAAVMGKVMAPKRSAILRPGR